LPPFNNIERLPPEPTTNPLSTTALPILIREAISLSELSELISETIITLQPLSQRYKALK
jgi:hypothetical protein